MIPLLFCKARNPGYTRKDGTYVKPFDDRRRAAKPKPLGGSPGKQPVSSVVSGSLFTPKAAAPQADNMPSCAIQHPKPDDDGKPKMIHYPSAPTSVATWASQADAAVFTPGSATPPVLNGVPVAPWADTPDGEEDWATLTGRTKT